MDVYFSPWIIEQLLLFFGTNAEFQRINYFSKELWFLSLENGIRYWDLGVSRARCFFGAIKLGNKYINKYKIHLYLFLYLFIGNSILKICPYWYLTPVQHYGIYLMLSFSLFVTSFSISKSLASHYLQYIYLFIQI